MKKLLALLLAGLAINAYAENWVVVSESDNAVYKVDTDTIAKIEKYQKADVNINYSEPAQIPRGKFTFICDQSMFFFDCKKRKMGRATQTLYSEPDGNGESKLIYSGTIDQIKFEKVEDETIGAILLDYICVGKHPPKERKNLIW